MPKNWTSTSRVEALARLRQVVPLERQRNELTSIICSLRAAIQIRDGKIEALRLLVHERNERIDQLTAQVDQLRQHSRHADEGAEYMAMFVGLILDLDDAVAAKQSAACVIG
jgi:hypothetical protein